MTTPPPAGDLLTAAGKLLEEIANHDRTVESCGRDGHCIDDIARAAEALAAAINHTGSQA